MTENDELSPEDEQYLNDRKRLIAEYWNQLSFCEDSGGTTWELLDDLRLRVTECLERGEKSDISMADRLTATAEYLRRYGTDQ